MEELHLLFTHNAWCLFCWKFESVLKWTQFVSALTPGHTGCAAHAQLTLTWQCLFSMHFLTWFSIHEAVIRSLRKSECAEYCFSNTLFSCNTTLHDFILACGRGPVKAIQHCMALPAIPGTPSNFLPVWQTNLKSPIHNQIHVMNINPKAESNSGNNNS